MSSAIADPLRRRSLPRSDFPEPERVLAALNRAFPMEEHAGRFFTIWYGVYDSAIRKLSYASAGHPPAILLDGGRRLVRLGQPGLLDRRRCRCDLRRLHARPAARLAAVSL